jgi:2-polyprenyl-3-methyl-5-hydroxy-6-metoxy-1,4-benzoquinol methylase
LVAKLRYLLWSAAHLPLADKTCIGCGSRETYLVKRKYTNALYGCPACKLMFRVPKDTPGRARTFYDSEYKQGFTTDCPTPEVLEALKRTRFAGTEKDYGSYLSVLEAVGVLPGMSIVDFGCSWGYGSWQMTQAGYEVYSYEIARSRARYAESKLGCRMVTPENLDRQVDCFFSAHVLEHLNDPRQMWVTAHKLLKPGGVAVVFLPNGSLSQPKVHSIWGKVHPLLIVPEALVLMAKWAGFSGLTYSSPYNVEEIRRGTTEVQLSGPELVIVARK